MVEQLVEQQQLEQLFVELSAPRRLLRRQARAGPQPPGRAATWLLAAVAFAGGLALLQTVPASPGDLSPGVGVLVIGGLYALTEVAVIHIHFRRDAFTIALGEVPLVIGLFFATPATLAAGRLVGAGLALAFHRRQPVRKLSFNLAQFLLATAVTCAVFAALRGGGTVMSLRAVAAAMMAAVAGEVTSALSIALVMHLVGAREALGRLRSVAIITIPATVLNTLLAIAAARLLLHDQVAAALTMLPIVALGISYRRYVGERRKHERVQLLYDSSQALHRAHGVDDAMATLLRSARDMFHAEVAELVLFPVGNDGDALHISLEGPEAQIHRRYSVPDERAVEVWRGGKGVLLSRSSRGSRTWTVGERSVRDCMMAALRSDEGAFATLMVANRSGDVGTFDRPDLTLLVTFATQASISVEKGRLVAATERLAFYDPLTRLANRSLLVQRLSAAMQRAATSRRQPAVLFLDVDDFKTVNDSLGHTYGDRLLVAVASRLRQCLRPDDVAARIGGDEFAVMLDVAGASDAALVAQRIIETMRVPFELEGGEQVTTHVSVGLVHATGDEGDVDELLARADIAMYRAKERGKGCWELFAPELQHAVVERHRLKSDLSRALAAGDLFLAYQPIVALDTQRPVGAEALVRWRHPEQGMVSPDRFISLAEESGLIADLGAFVLEEACRRATDWSGDNVYVSVNLSARQLQRPEFPSEVAATLLRTGLPAQRLVLEITERVMVDSDAVVRAGLGALRDMGVRLAIDDFGTGYSSLSMLRDLPVDILKLDKSFVDDVDRTANGTAFAAAILRLGQTLGLTVVAEGIEEPAQARRLRSLRCRFGQGYLFARPMDAAAIAEVMAGAGLVRAAAAAATATAPA